jgi:O-antigen ligase
MFKEHPVLGIGLGNYARRYLAYAQRLGLDKVGEVRQAHNRYMEVAVESGLVGLTAFGAMLIVALWRLWPLRRRLVAAGRADDVVTVACVGGAFMGYLAAAAFLHASWMGHFGFLLGLVLALPTALGEGRDEHTAEPGMGPALVT